MVDVSISSHWSSRRTRYGDLVRADVHLPAGAAGLYPVLLAASHYQKVLEPLPPVPSVCPFIEYGPMQLYLDQGYAYVAVEGPGMGRSEGTWTLVSRAEGDAIHDMIKDVAALDWAGPIGMIGTSYYSWSQWNTGRTRPPSLACIAADLPGKCRRHGCACSLPNAAHLGLIKARVFTDRRLQ